jgi:hypothetical protein
MFKENGNMNRQEIDSIEKRVRTIDWFSSSCEYGVKYSDIKAGICDVAWFFS